MKKIFKTKKAAMDWGRRNSGGLFAARKIKPGKWEVTFRGEDHFKRTRARGGGGGFPINPKLNGGGFAGRNGRTPWKKRRILE